MFIERYPAAIQDPDLLGCLAEHVVFNALRKRGRLLLILDIGWLVSSFEDLRDEPRAMSGA